MVSIAAGLKILYFKEQLAMCGDALKVVRVMPNTPSAIGKGMLAVCAGPEVESEYISGVCGILSDAGRVECLGENLMDQFSVVGGCAPAFVYMFIEALADGGVKIGLPRAQAMTYAAQTVLGAAAMVLESGQHPGVLKDAVCSPRGLYDCRRCPAGKAGIPVQRLLKPCVQVMKKQLIWGRLNNIYEKTVFTVEGSGSTFGSFFIIL